MTEPRTAEEEQALTSLAKTLVLGEGVSAVFWCLVKRFGILVGTIAAAIALWKALRQ